MWSKELGAAQRVGLGFADGEGRESEVSVYFQPQAHVDAVVGLLLKLISHKCEIPLGPDGLHIGETLHPDYASESGWLEAEDIRIPLPHRITRVRVEKPIHSGAWSEHDGELKLHLGAGTQVGLHPRSLECFEIGLKPFVASPIAVQIAMLARRPSGEPVTRSFSFTFAGAANVADVHASIASYPNPRTLRMAALRRCESRRLGAAMCTSMRSTARASCPAA
jgi:hypothetical protein